MNSADLSTSSTGNTSGNFRGRLLFDFLWGPNDFIGFNTLSRCDVASRDRKLYARLCEFWSFWDAIFGEPTIVQLFCSASSIDYDVHAMTANVSLALHLVKIWFTAVTLLLPTAPRRTMWLAKNMRITEDIALRSERRPSSSAKQHFSTTGLQFYLMSKSKRCPQIDRGFWR